MHCAVYDKEMSNDDVTDYVAWNEEERVWNEDFDDNEVWNDNVDDKEVWTEDVNND